jgi:hypothetical protein
VGSPDVKQALLERLHGQNQMNQDPWAKLWYDPVDPLTFDALWAVAPPRKGCRPYESRPTVRRLDTAKAGRSGLASVKECRPSRRLRASKSSD